MQDLKTIKRHWYMVFFDYTFLMISKIKGFFSKLAKRLKIKVIIIGDCKRGRPHKPKLVVCPELRYGQVIKE